LDGVRRAVRPAGAVLRAVLHALLELAAPVSCPVCGHATGGPCACRRCRLPDRGKVIRQLRADRAGAYLVLSGGPFEATLREMVHAYKYREDPFAERLLVRQLIHAVGRHRGWCAVVPVPTHPVRVRERGFAAVERLAAGLAREIGLPVVPLLVRARYNPPLTGRRAAERRRLLACAMTVRGRADGALLLLDDVATTGTTLRLARGLLLEAGAEGVDLITVARTPRPGEGVSY